VDDFGEGVLHQE